MSKATLLSLAITAILLIVINLMPTNKGLTLYCHSGMERFYRPQETHGLPFTYIKMNRIGSACYSVSDISGAINTKQSSTLYDTHTILPAGLVGDVVVAAIILSAQTLLLKRQGARV